MYTKGKCPKMAQKIIDLTVELTNNMPCHKFFPRPVIIPHFTHDDMESWGNGTPEDPLGGCKIGRAHV